MVVSYREIMGICGSTDDVAEHALPGKYSAGPPVSLSINEKHLEIYDSLNDPNKVGDGVDVDGVVIDVGEEAADTGLDVNDGAASDGEGVAADGSNEEGGDAVPNPECKSIEGQLKKKSPGLMGGWQIRFCVLQANSILSYYGAEIDFKSNREAKGTINLADIAPSARNDLIDDEEEPTLFLPIAERVYEFQGEDASITQLWHATIMSHF